MLKYISAIFLSLSVVSAQAAETLVPHGDAAIIAEAEAYLDAYSRLDTSALEQVYAEDAVFEDPTSTNVKGIGGPFRWRGRAQILASLREWAKSTKSLKYSVERRYEASNHVVFVGTVFPLVKSSKGDVQYSYPIVTIVNIANGRVVEHRDYTNYAAGKILPSAYP